MSTTDDLKRHFEELKAQSLRTDARLHGSGLWSSWHHLADAEYEPAKEFFIERLQDTRSAWRQASVSLLGFHYKLEDHIIEKIRDLLAQDADSGVRISAASVLGSQGQFPEKTLIHALDHDADDLVRESAFFALLELAAVPYNVQTRELKRVKSKEISPSLDQVKRVLREQNMSANVSLLEETKD